MSKYVVVDLEMCKVRRSTKTESFHYGQELIEIGAVLLNESFEIVDDFKTYVTPEFGVVDTYIQNLTGISRMNTKDAPSAKEALKLFAEWLPEESVLVSWSDNDEKQVRKEIEIKNINLPEMDRFLDGWIDCQKTFSERVGCAKNYRLSEALILSDIDYEDGAHDALIDAHNTALLFAKMMREPEFKIINLNGDDCAEFVYNPFAVFLENYKQVG